MGLCLAAMLKLLEEREGQRQVEPDIDMQAWMKARVSEGIHSSVATELMLRLLGLEVSVPTPKP